MIEIENDNAKNLFTIRYHGRVDADETEQWLAPMQAGVAKLRSGFALLVDLTDLESMDLGCAPHIREMMEFCNGRGVSTVVRVIPDPRRDIGMEIMSRFHYAGNVRIVTCATIEEATKILFD
jgi:anti-anti-sigma regulatory factor